MDVVHLREELCVATKADYIPSKSAGGNGRVVVVDRRAIDECKYKGRMLFIDVRSTIKLR